MTIIVKRRNFSEDVCAAFSALVRRTVSTCTVCIHVHVHVYLYLYLYVHVYLFGIACYVCLCLWRNLRAGTFVSGSTICTIPADAAHRRTDGATDASTGLSRPRVWRDDCRQHRGRGRGEHSKQGQWILFFPSTDAVFFSWLQTTSLFDQTPRVVKHCLSLASSCVF